MMDVLKTLEVQEGTDVKKLEKRDFTEIKPKENLSVSDARSFFDRLFQEMYDKEKNYYTSYEDRINHTPKEDSDLGTWEGERGESKFVPNEENEAGAAAKEKLAEYGMDGVEYESAEPDFSKCNEAEVKIDKMTENRENYVDENGEYQQGNFAQADAKCAELWNSTKRDGKDDWTAADGDEAYPEFSKKDFRIKTGLQIIPADSAHVLRQHQSHFHGLNVGHQPFPCLPVEIPARPTASNNTE